MAEHYATTQDEPLLDRPQAAALEGPVQEAVEALQFALDGIEAAAQREKQFVAETMAAWEALCRSGESSVEAVEDRASAPEPEPSLVGKEDWPALLFQMRGGWRPACERVADVLENADRRVEARAIRETTFFPPEWPSSGKEMVAVRDAERERIARLLRILRPLAEDLKQSSSGPPRAITQRLADPRGERGGSKSARRSPDFRSVQWFGRDYSFTPNQAACIKILWEAWENRTPEVSGAHIIESADIQDSTGRFDNVFRGCEAWGSMVVPGKTKGTYRLKEPEDK